MSSDPLIVPVQVQAMVLNSTEVQFIRGSMDYGQLAYYADPSPAPFDCDPTDFSAQPGSQGVYVLWNLPQALRHGRQQNPGGDITFPFVPNRWLVVRLFRPAAAANTATAPQATAWVVQSDLLNGDAGSSYIDPTQPDSPSPTTLGGFVEITPASPWQEPASASPYFLQAVSEGNPAFAAYQPFNENVFSFFDALGSASIEAGVLSYFVLGWYSDSTADVLARWPASGSGTEVAAFLDGLNWTAGSDGSSFPEGPLTSLYHGWASSVLWNPKGAIPASPKDGVTPAVAAGNTSIDGVVAFAQAMLANETPPSTDPTPQEAGELLEAFQYNVLPLLGEPGGEVMLEERIRQQWFGSTDGGTAWVIVDAPVTPGSVPPEPPDAGELEAEATWLAALNAAQALADSLRRTLLGVQRRLFELWWKQGAGNSYSLDQDNTWPWGTTAGQFTQAIADEATTAQTLQGDLAAQLLLVPTPTQGETLADAIAAFAAAKNLPATRLLKAVAQPRFWSSADPVLVLSNTAHLLSSEPDGALSVRWPGQLVTSLNVSAAGGTTQGPSFTVTSSQLSGWVPPLPYANLPALSEPLFEEFFLMDTANAALLAAVAGQQLDADQLDAVSQSMAAASTSAAGEVPAAVIPPFPWGQPWQPVFLDWQVNWYPIPFQQADATPNWTFNGSDYVLADNFVPLDATTPISFSGRCILTPKPSMEFQARIAQYIDDYPGTTAALQLMKVQGELDWDFLSQRLSGLEAQIAKWNPMVVQQPDTSPLTGGGSMKSLIGDAADMPPNPQMAAAERFQPVPASNFEGMRAGQFVINQLTVVDAWGQTLDVVLAPVGGNPCALVPRTNTVFEPLAADGVAPSGNFTTEYPQRFIELPPRMLQPSRLNFVFTPNTNGNPILGWIVPNHLDSALGTYDADGSALGELVLGVGPDGQPAVNWIAAPGSTLPLLPASTDNLPPLTAFLAALQAQGVAGLGDLLTAVDETLWTVAPSGGRADAFLSVLMGRPLAIVASSLSFELQAEVARDTDWPYTFADPRPDPAFLSYRFPVRLGDLGYREDGLLGYFVNGDYSSFKAIHVPDEVQGSYLEEIGVGNYLDLGFSASGPGAAAALTMIMDPRGSVHAQCGFLPVKDISLLPKWVDDALASMVVSFRTGPVLVESGLAPAAGAAPPVSGLLLPRPAELSGTWSWMESGANAGEWNQLPLLPVDATATLQDTPPSLREGRLVLSSALQR